MKVLLSMVMRWIGSIKSVFKRFVFTGIFFDTLMGLTVKVAGAIAAIVLNVLVTRSLGASEAGLYYLCFALVMFLSTVGSLGLEAPFVRFISIEVSKRSGNSSLQVFRIGLVTAVSLSSVIAAAIIFFHTSSAVFLIGTDEYSRDIWFIYLAIPAIASYTLCANALKGMGQIPQAILLLNLSVPTIMVSMVLIYWCSDFTVFNLAVWFCSATALTAIFGVLYVVRALYPYQQTYMFSKRKLFRTSLPLWHVAIIGQATLWAGQFSLGLYGTSAEVAVFASAQRISMLLSFLLVAINAAIGSRVALLYEEKDPKAIEKLLGTATRSLMLVGAILLSVILVYSDEIMAIFGPDFRDAGLVLTILALGQFVNVATGSVGLVLSVTGCERSLRNISIVTGLLIVVLLAVLTPIFGVVGASIATALAVMFQNIASVISLRKNTGISLLRG